MNAGIAFGSFAGGAAIVGGGIPFAVVAGIVIAVAAVTAAWATSALRPAVAASGTESTSVGAGSRAPS